MQLDPVLLTKIENNDPNLTSLNLSWKEIGAVGGEALARAIAKNDTLKTLNLSWNLLGAVGTIALLQVLARRCSLTTLSLRGNLLCAGRTTAALAKFLECNDTLVTLDLSKNWLEDEGAHDLAKGLASNYTLMHLDLSSNDISNECIADINLLMARNHQAMLARRRQFITGIILLANSISVFHQEPLWDRLPKEIKLHVLSFLRYHGRESINKDAQQIYQCAEFIVKNIEECKLLIQQRKNIKIMEKSDGINHYRFRFFKPNLMPISSKQAEPVQVNKRTKRYISCT